MTTTTTGHRVPMTRHVVPGITHGIKTGYTVRGCRCEPCTTAQTRYTKAWRYHQSQGRPPLLLDSQPVRDHVQALRDAGMAFSAITAAAGYASRNALVSALSRDKVQRVTYRRIMAVTLDSDQRGTRYVPLLGSQRRLQALMAIDLNWSEEGALNSAWGKRFFAQAKTRLAVAAIKRRYGSVVQWGGDWRTLKDYMHWEIRPGTSRAKVVSLARQLGIDYEGRRK